MSAEKEYSETLPNEDTLVQKWLELGLLIDWITKQSNAEVNGISEYVETKVSDLIKNFHEISAQAKEQSNRVDSIVESSTSIRIGDDNVAITEIISKLDNLITTMINESVDISKNAMDLVFIMNQVIEDSQKINESLVQIYQITKDTKYLSVNALIEAARAGEAGKGFAVVANEVGDLSQNTENLADTMGELIKSFTHKIEKGFTLLEDIASKDLTEQLQAKKDIDETLNAMVEQAELQKETLKNSVKSSHDISASISNLIMTMQFQDYTTQRLQHVVSASESIQSEIQALVRYSHENSSLSLQETELSKEAAMAMLDKFSLSQIKENFIKSLSDNDMQDNIINDIPEISSDSLVSSEDNDDDDGVELF